MIVAGIGVVFTRGRGVAAFETALREGWRAPERRPLRAAVGESVPVYPVDDGDLRDRAVLARMRRADRFTKMSVLAASDAVADSGLEIPTGDEDLGILLASGLGSHVTAFRFLDEMLEYGETGPSPTLFSHSVQNAAASHVALGLRSHGPTMTLTQFHFSFHQALVLAAAWLREGRCSRVLVGATEECGAVMEYVCHERIGLAADGRIEPLRFEVSPAAVPGEGSVFFLLTRDEPPKRYAEFRGTILPGEPRDTRSTEAKRPIDLRLLDADGLTPDETSYRSALDGATAVAAYSPVFGSMMTGTAFHCAAASLMLRHQVCFGAPVEQNPLGIETPRSTEPARLEEIDCIRHDCSQREAVVRLKR